MFDLQATAIVNLRALQFTSEDCKFEDYSRALVNLQARVLWVADRPASLAPRLFPPSRFLAKGCFS